MDATAHWCLRGDVPFPGSLLSPILGSAEDVSIISMLVSHGVPMPEVPEGPTAQDTTASVLHTHPSPWSEWGKDTGTMVWAFCSMTLLLGSTLCPVSPWYPSSPYLLPVPPNQKALVAVASPTASTAFHISSGSLGSSSSSWGGMQLSSLSLQRPNKSLSHRGHAATCYQVALRRGSRGPQGP